jgi:hypothetical protein
MYAARAQRIYLFGRRHVAQFYLHPGVAEPELRYNPRHEHDSGEPEADGKSPDLSAGRSPALFKRSFCLLDQPPGLFRKQTADLGQTRPVAPAVE